ncbi:hypothetical protein [Undibacterium sp. Ren11W]|uniref:hypothetical protein n=1 Tax=Undibacterium sp. Ren11W TaxID=3413045 RepID=UPI003BF1FAAD
MSTQSANHYSREDWQNGSQRQRMLAASLALFLTLMLVKLLAYTPGLQSRRLSPDSLKQTINLRFIELTLPKEVKTEAKSEDRPVASVQKNTSQYPPQKKSISIAPTTLTASPAAISVAADLPADPLSTPLQIDSEAIRRAYQDSKSEIELQAERSGKQLNDKPRTKFDRLETAVAGAAKPDCLGKDSGGAGLLAIPLALYLLAADKCK